MPAAASATARRRMTRQIQQGRTVAKERSRKAWARRWIVVACSAAACAYWQGRTAPPLSNSSMAMAMPAVIGRSARPAAAVRTDPEDGRCRVLAARLLFGGCDPRPPRRTDAALQHHRGDRREVGVAILVRPGGRTLRSGCRSPRSNSRGSILVRQEDGRCGLRCTFPTPLRLRSSSAPEGTTLRCSAAAADNAAGLLRSSSAPEDGRCARRARPDPPPDQGCDPRPPRRTDAAGRPVTAGVVQVDVAILVRPGGRTLLARPGQHRRGPVPVAILVRPEDGRCRDQRRLPGPLGPVAILVRPGGRTLPVGAHGSERETGAVAILVRPGGRTLHRESTDTGQSWSCDPRPPRRTDAASRRASRTPRHSAVAILVRPGGRTLPRLKRQDADSETPNRLVMLRSVDQRADQ